MTRSSGMSWYTDLVYLSTGCCPGKVHCCFTLGHHWHGQVLSSFCVSFCPSVHPLLSLWGLQILACSLTGWCTVPWSRSPFKQAIFRQFLHSLMLASSGCCHCLNILLYKSQYWGTIIHSVVDKNYIESFEICAGDDIGDDIFKCLLFSFSSDPPSWALWHCYGPSILPSRETEASFLEHLYWIFCYIYANL